LALLPTLILALLLAVGLGLSVPDTGLSPVGLSGASAALLPPTTSTTSSPPASDEELPAFHLPFPLGTGYLVSQGNAGNYIHQARRLSEFAWDFVMSEGSVVVAAAAGRVAAVEEGMRGGGFSDLYAGYANYVLIEHAGGLYSPYLHLATTGVLVFPGQLVTAGQPIALSGDTGYSSGPHLHFQVQEPAVSTVDQSIAVRFFEAGVPRFGARPVSENAYQPPAGMPNAAAPGLSSPLDTPSFGRPQLVTGRRLAVWASWGSGEAAATPVRLVAVDGSGRRWVVATGTSGDPGGFHGLVVPARPDFWGRVETSISDPVRRRSGRGLPPSQTRGGT